LQNGKTFTYTTQQEIIEPLIQWSILILIKI
jgi:hypothetical protein